MKTWLKRIAVVLLLVLAGFLFGFVPWWLADRVTTRRFAFNDRENAGITPASFELPYEDVEFRSPDGLTLKGWWVPAAASKGTVVLVHGLFRSRIEMARKLPFLQREGWNALLFDLRHHGASAGDLSTFGDREKGDVKAATAFALGRAPGPVVLWGVSLGAASAMLAAADDASVAGVVCDSSYRSLSDTVRHHTRLARRWRWWLRIVPQWPVADEVLFWMGRRGRFDPDAVDVQAAAARLPPRPSLFVCNSGDRRMPQEIAFGLQAAAGARARVLVVPGNSHGGAYRDGTAAYESAVSELLREALLGAPGPALTAATEAGRSSQ